MQDLTSLTASVRPPIVAVLGHVDHGKTSLLDSIRQSNIAAREAGGITQSIGASTITAAGGKKITFLDTPGHAAFSQMRSRGARVADIIILVVAADDGVKPQTREALDHILASSAKFLVAFTKIDLPSASIENAQTQLEQLGVYFEGRGGDIPYVGVSSKTGEGIKDLLELVLLIAEVNEFKADPAGELEAVIIETSKDKRGQLASAVVRNGTLSIGQTIAAETVQCKIKGLFDDQNKPVKQILPGEAGVILGFTTLPPVGAVVTEGESKPQPTSSAIQRDLTIPEGKIGIFLKTQTAGALEALLGSLPADVVVIGSGIGDVSESDVLFAKSANIAVFTFESKTPATVARLAETEGVTIESFTIIYELIQRLEEILKSGLKEIKGKAEIIASFPFNNKRVAGSKVVSGTIKKGDEFVLLRAEKELGKVRVISLRKMKHDIQEAKAGEELGILFEPQFAFESGDVLVSHSK